MCVNDITEKIVKITKITSRLSDKLSRKIRIKTNKKDEVYNAGRYAHPPIGRMTS